VSGHAGAGEKLARRKSAEALAAAIIARRGDLHFFGQAANVRERLPVAENIDQLKIARLSGRIIDRHHDFVRRLMMIDAYRRIKTAMHP